MLLILQQKELSDGNQGYTRVQVSSKAAEKKAEPRAEISQTARMRQVP